MYYIYPRKMTEVNVFATMGMSATVGEMSATVGGGDVRNSGGRSVTVGEVSATVG